MTMPVFATAACAKKRTIVDWQNGISSPTGAQLAALAEVGVDVLYVVTGNRVPQELRSAHRDLIAAYDRATPDGAYLLGLAAKLAAHPTKAGAAFGALLLVEALA